MITYDGNDYTVTDYNVTRHGQNETLASHLGFYNRQRGF